ncbi:MAG: glycosyltransferase [Myxococcaceae bacterium]|nr:glycosyltransferase [Myxococcaceae bacterium]
MKYVILGLSVTSSWGNGHATTYRGLIKAMVARGHDVLFLERDVPWYASQRDLPVPPYGRTALYQDRAQLEREHADSVRDADVVIVGSYVPEGVEVADWVLRQARGVTAFYDIDTPITLAGLASGEVAYLEPALIPRFDLYLSFSGGPMLERLEREFGARLARPLYCSVDPALYAPREAVERWALGYLGTYSPDRQPTVDALLREPAARLRDQAFIVAGAQYPEALAWPDNVTRVSHIAPAQHPQFYAAQRFTLNVTRAEMVRAGYSPSVRLFEAAACGTPIISDAWAGIEEVLTPGSEVLIARTTADVLGYLHDFSPRERSELAQRARLRVLQKHTAAERAAELDDYVREARGAHEPLRVRADHAERGVSEALR